MPASEARKASTGGTAGRAVMRYVKEALGRISFSRPWPVMWLR